MVVMNGLRTGTALQVSGFAALLLISGCRICADCEDLAYPAYGGAWQRTLRETGRVGSIFDPAGAKAFDLAARNQPEDADQLERLRYKARGGGVQDPEDLQDAETEDAQDGRQQRNLQDRQNELRDRQLEDIENPLEEEQQQKSLDQIDVRVIPGPPAPPLG